MGAFGCRERVCCFDHGQCRVFLCLCQDDVLLLVNTNECSRKSSIIAELDMQRLEDQGLEKRCTGRRHAGVSIDMNLCLSQHLCHE